MRMEELFEEEDVGLFLEMRERIRSGETLKNIVEEYFGGRVSEDEGGGDDGTGVVSSGEEGVMDYGGYDDLDVFVNRLLSDEEMPLPVRELEPEMVAYYKTPARLVFEWVKRIGFTADDVFVDLGSGLGQVAILTHLLTGIEARGVEIEPAYCEFARRSVAGLGLSGVKFVTGDAREVDLSGGTVFFLYTPFRGEVLQTVLGRLRQVSRSRRIKIIAYGPCAPEVAEQDWLRSFEVLGNGALGVTYLFHDIA
jgi:hypothetical protein